jgi:hypothetical protein
LFWALWILIDAAVPTAGSSSGSEIAHVDGRHRPTPVSTYPNIEVDFDDEGRGADVELEDRGEVIDEPFAPALIDVQSLTPTVNLLLAAPQWCPRPPARSRGHERDPAVADRASLAWVI